MSHRTLRSGHDIASGSTKAHRVTVPCSRLRLQTGSEPLWSRALLPHVRCPQCPMCAATDEDACDSPCHHALPWLVATFHDGTYGRRCAGLGVQSRRA